jgi:hypothetical protein
MDGRIREEMTTHLPAQPEEIIEQVVGAAKLGANLAKAY